MKKETDHTGKPRFDCGESKLAKSRQVPTRQARRKTKRVSGTSPSTVIYTKRGPMTVGLDQFNRKTKFLTDAVKAGKLVQGSRAYQVVGDVFDLNEHMAGNIVAELQANPLARTDATEAPVIDALQAYDSSWLTKGERARIDGRTRVHTAND
jgi:hypothetical protein